METLVFSESNSSTMPETKDSNSARSHRKEGIAFLRSNFFCIALGPLDSIAEIIYSAPLPHESEERLHRGRFSSAASGHRDRETRSPSFEAPAFEELLPYRFDGRGDFRLGEPFRQLPARDIEDRLRALLVVRRLRRRVRGRFAIET